MKRLTRLVEKTARDKTSGEAWLELTLHSVWFLFFVMGLFTVLYGGTAFSGAVLFWVRLWGGMIMSPLCLVLILYDVLVLRIVRAGEREANHAEKCY